MLAPSLPALLTAVILAGAPDLATEGRTFMASGLPKEVRLQIPLVYTNGSGQRRYLPSCHAPPPACLEKLERTGWVTVWCPIVQSCETIPVPLVEPGAAFTWTVWILGALDGSFLPEFKVVDVPGTYRLRWSVSRTPEPSPVNAVVLYSNSFQIALPPPP